MRVLGIETSCDETAAAVVEDGGRILSNIVVSQIDIHKAFGGVVPEVAARSHIEVILPVIDEAVREAYIARHSGLDPESSHSKSTGDPWLGIDAIAVANTPGLVGSLLIGTLTAKTLAKLKNKPLYPVNHVISHVYANFLQPTKPSFSGLSRESSAAETASPSNPSETASHRVSPDEQLKTTQDNSTETRAADVSEELDDSAIEFPLLALVVSGGHTQLMIFRSHTDYEIVGQTRDDAVGEAFDKVAKILGLPYPGGPSIAEEAQKGQPIYKLPHPKLDNPLDFSFSGLKTAVLRAVQAEVGKDYTFPSNELAGLLSASQRADFAASFQKTAVDILVEKLELAYQKYQPKSVCLAGGVSANALLRQEVSKKFPDILLPAAGFSTDNAAMVASRGYFQSLSERPIDPSDIDVKPT